MPKDSGGRLPKGSTKLDYTSPDIKRTILRLKMKGESLEHIARYLKKQYGYTAHPTTISTFLKKSTDLGPKMLFQRDEYVNELESNYVETLREFKKLVEFTWKLVEEMRMESEGKGVKAKSEVLRGVTELRQQIQLANELLGALPKGSEAAIDTAQAVNLALQKLQKVGLIKGDELVAPSDAPIKSKREEEAEEEVLELPKGEPVKIRQGISLMGFE